MRIKENYDVALKNVDEPHKGVIAKFVEILDDERLTWARRVSNLMTENSDLRQRVRDLEDRVETQKLSIKEMAR